MVPLALAYVLPFTWSENYLLHKFMFFIYKTFWAHFVGLHEKELTFMERNDKEKKPKGRGVACELHEKKKWIKLG